MYERHFISDDINSKLWVSGMVSVAMWLASVGSSRGEVLASWDFGGGLLSPSFLAMGVGASIIINSISIFLFVSVFGTLTSATILGGNIISSSG